MKIKVVFKGGAEKILNIVTEDTVKEILTDLRRFHSSQMDGVILNCIEEFVIINFSKVLYTEVCK